MDVCLCWHRYIRSANQNGVSNLVNNGGSLIAGSINLCPGCNYIQNSGSSDIDNITGDGKVIINGGEVTTNGLLTLIPRKLQTFLLKISIPLRR